MKFGEFVKDCRIKQKLTLRDFCRINELDPSNWSKIERGILAPPKSKAILNEIANSLEIPMESEEYYTLFDLALVSHIPIDLVGDQSYLEKLPVFFRTLRGEKPNESELEKILNIVKGNNLEE
ncbi:MAG: helix-turn-helix domain-containing protein [Candidatus Marinimicrobia bacterium]|nr:helix-turn-helix domain-containing protein [Candidatus Neomarinimicrobiota bacterium]